MIDPTPTEREAVLLRWRAKHPEAGPNEMPSAEETAVLLREIRERAIAIENASLEILKRKMHIRPTGGGRGSIQGVMIAAGVIVGLLALYFVIKTVFAH